eukprot:PhM_4_TR1497/c0_g1_i1/m.12145
MMRKASVPPQPCPDPDADDAHVLQQATEASQLFTLGDELFRSEKFDEATANYEKSLSLRKGMKELGGVAGKMQQHLLHARIAACHMHRAQFDAALTEAEAMLDLEVSSHKGWALKALIHRSMGKVDEALHDIRMASRLSPTNPKYTALHAALMNDKKKASHPDSPQSDDRMELSAHASNLATATDCLKSYHLHEDEIMDSILAGASSSTHSHAHLKPTASNVEDAEEDCARVEQMGSFNAATDKTLVNLRFRTKRGEALSHIGRYEEALKDIDQVLALCPSDEHALVVRAECLVHLHKKEEAIAELRAALTELPESGVIRDLLHELDK